MVSGLRPDVSGSEPMVMGITSEAWSTYCFEVLVSDMFVLVSFLEGEQWTVSKRRFGRFFQGKKKYT
jgi:hypothetical protein